MKTSGPTGPVAYIEGLPISCSPVEQVLAEMDRAITAREAGHYISITNTEMMYHGLRIPSHGEYIKHSDFSLCDGVGVIVAGLAWGHVVPRLNGPVLQLAATDYGQAKGWRHFFYGGKEGVAELLAEKLKERYPGIIVCGMYTPPFGDVSPEEDQKIVDAIDASKADIVWVGLGVLKQERWIAAHIDRIPVPWMVGVGAAFDYHSGAIPWAPAPIRAIGMEWLFRLILQPKLRAKRYWWSAIYVAEAFFHGLLTFQFLRNKQQGQKS
jgi:N-acetylglucosaminyldiphosphoundecaprenol N-acetyl-beta-D-mannosaminyltransferase